MVKCILALLVVGSSFFMFYGLSIVDERAVNMTNYTAVCIRLDFARTCWEGVDICSFSFPGNEPGYEGDCGFNDSGVVLGVCKYRFRYHFYRLLSYLTPLHPILEICVI